MVLNRIFTLIIFIIISFKSLACDCEEAKTLDDEIKNFEVIFVGKLIKHDSTSNLYYNGGLILNFTTFEVIKIYKGISLFNTKISVLSNRSNCDIGFNNFNLGDTILFYGYYNDEREKFITTHKCTWTKNIKEVTIEELNFLANKKWRFPIKSNFEKYEIELEQREMKNRYLLYTIYIVLTISGLCNILFIVNFINRKKY